MGAWLPLACLNEDFVYNGNESAWFLKETLTPAGVYGEAHFEVNPI